MPLPLWILCLLRGHSVELPNPQDFVKAAREAREESYHAVTSSLKGVAKLVEARMTAIVASSPNWSGQRRWLKLNPYG